MKECEFCNHKWQPRPWTKRLRCPQCLQTPQKPSRMAKRAVHTGIIPKPPKLPTQMVRQFLIEHEYALSVNRVFPASSRKPGLEFYDAHL
jgi:hypothetical protein